MTVKGKVVATSAIKGRFVVAFDAGWCAAFELISWVECEPGDLVEWEPTTDKRTMLTNVSRAGNSLHVTRLRAGCSEPEAMAFLSV